MMSPNWSPCGDLDCAPHATTRPLLPDGLPGHRLGDESADALGGLDKMTVGQVGVARHRAVAPVADQLADLGQVLPGHNGVVG